MNSSLMRFALLAGVALFICMAISHFFGIKIPLMFVYYDTPFYAYQDKIISFAVIAYAGLFYLASKSRANVPVAIFVMGVTVLGLSSVNLSDALAVALEDGQSTLPYWLQTALMAVYFVILLLLYIRDGKDA